LRHDFRRIDPAQSRIVLIEAAGRLLTSFPETLAKYVERTLPKMGVEVLTSNLVTKCDAQGVTTERQRNEAVTYISAPGALSSPAAEWLHASRDRSGRVIVNPDLTVGELRNVFVIGDTAAVRDSDDRPVPGVAPAAKQMGLHAGRAIAALVRSGARPKPFVY